MNPLEHCALDEARQQIAMMIEHDKHRLESDSLVGSCDCLTKAPEVKYHKPGCKYRLITERDELREALSGRTVSCSQCNGSVQQLEDMRVAIGEAIEAFKAIAEAKDAPDIDIGGAAQFGLHCGVEDRGCQSRYDGADVGWSQGVERTLDWATNEANAALAKLQPFLP